MNTHFAEKTSEERQKDSVGLAAASEAATLRAQSKAKAEASSAEKVLFDKSKRQSMLTESMRRVAPNADTMKQVHDEVRDTPSNYSCCYCFPSAQTECRFEQSESGRKACASRDKQSCIFSASDSGASYRPLRVVNIKTPEVAEKTRCPRPESSVQLCSTTSVLFSTSKDFASDASVV